jgi:multisubunit Na+/H+ antiporter MnhB subunit
MSISFADEIRNRLPRILTNLVAMLAVIFLLYLIMPVAYVTAYVIPGVGLVGGVLVGIGALIISLIIETRIYRDMQSLSDAFATYAVARRKGLTPSRRERLRSALTDIGKSFSSLSYWHLSRQYFS